MHPAWLPTPPTPVRQPDRTSFTSVSARSRIASPCLAPFVIGSRHRSLPYVEWHDSCRTSSRDCPRGRYLSAALLRESLTEPDVGGVLHKLAGYQTFTLPERGCPLDQARWDE